MTASLERATARPIFRVTAGRATAGAEATAGMSSRATAGERRPREQGSGATLGLKSRVIASFWRPRVQGKGDFG